jgi:hypothetical protein
VRKADVLLIKLLSFHEQIPTSLGVMVYFVNASAKMFTVNFIKFRAHLVVVNGNLHNENVILVMKWTLIISSGSMFDLIQLLNFISK